MKYNSVENAERFLQDQMNWCIANGYKDFSIWSNGEELMCLSDDTNDLGMIFSKVDAQRKGFWRAFRMVNGAPAPVM